MLIILFAVMMAIIAIRIACRVSWIIGGEDEFTRFCAFAIMGVAPPYRFDIELVCFDS